MVWGIKDEYFEKVYSHQQRRKMSRGYEVPTEGGLATAPQREPEILNARNSLSKEIDELHECLHVLFNKIAPALAQPEQRPNQPDMGKAPPTKIYQSQLATQFVPMMDKVRQMISEVQRVCDAVEI